MVRITINNLKVKLEGDLVILKKLYNFLAYKHPEAFYIQQRLKHKWDGMVYPLSERGILSTGLLPKAWEFMSKFTDDYEVIDHRNIPEYEKIPTKVGNLTLRDFQVEGIRQIVSNDLYSIPWPRGFIFAGMAAGKTAMMMGVHLAYGCKPTLILVDNKLLYTQLKQDLYNTFSDYGYMQGKELKWGKVMVCMVQTLKNRLVEHSQNLREYEIMLVDEADLATSKTYTTIFKTLSWISVRVGFSGTIFLRELKKDILRNNTLREYFGEIIFSITSKELEDQGYTTKALIKIIPGMDPKNTNPEGFMEEFRDLLEDDPDRLDLLLQRVKYNLYTNKFPIMVYTRYISQTETIFKFLRSKLPKKYKIAFLHHKSEDKEQLVKFKDGKIHILVCSLFLKRGINLPRVKVIINMSAGEFYSNPIQILGRGVRLHDNKKVFIFEDFMDGGKYLSKHARQRLIHYKKQGHEIRYLGEKKS
jgi:superfamily II DNA or RNA helicase